MAWTQKQIDDLNNSMVAAQNVQLGTVINALVNNQIDRDSYTVTTAQASASKAYIPTDISAVTGWSVSIVRSGSIVTGDATIWASGSNIVVEDGDSTYNLTTNDKINYVVW